jgi:hypothetical protein
MPLSGNGHHNPVLIEVRLRALRLRIGCSSGREEARHQWGELGEILELPQMKELPKRTLHEKGRHYSLVVRWAHVAGGAAGPARWPRNLRL